MEIVLHDIKDSEAWAISLKIGESTYYTLHYDTDSGEGVLHTDDNLVGFKSYEELKSFCEARQLTLVRDEIARSFDFNFDIPSDAPCKMIIEHWNLLAVMANILSCEFEGKKKEYEKLYGRLFDHAPSSNITLALDELEHEKLVCVFKDKEKLLDKFVFFTNDDE